MTANNVIQVKNLEVKYSKNIAIKNMTLSLPKGEIIGLVGENGSGKTTLMRVISGMIQNYKGTVIIDNKTNTWDSKEIVCYYPSNAYFDGSATLEQTIKLYSSLFRGYNQDLAYKMFEQFGFELSFRLNQLSKGKCALAIFILQLSKNAQLYIFDEPFSGIDIKTRSLMKDALLHNADPEKTYLISTHEITDMESLFDRIVLIKDGRVALNDVADVLREQYGKSIAEIIKEVL